MMQRVIFDDNLEVHVGKTKQMFRILLGIGAKATSESEVMILQSREELQGRR
jgi:hypothetical protein